MTGEDVRRGLETMNITEARWKELGLPNFAAQVQVTCADHSGHAPAYMQQWDGAKWVPQTDWFSAYDDVVQDIVKKESGEFAKNKQ